MDGCGLVCNIARVAGREVRPTYLDSVDGDGQFDHFVVFGQLVLRRWSAGPWRGACPGAYLVGEGEEVHSNGAAAGFSSVTASIVFCDWGALQALTSCPLPALSSRGTSSRWPSSTQPSQPRSSARPARPRALVSMDNPQMAGDGSRITSKRIAGGARVCWVAGTATGNGRRAWSWSAACWSNHEVARPPSRASRHRNPQPATRRLPIVVSGRRPNNCCSGFQSVHVPVLSGASMACPRFPTPQHRLLCASQRFPWRKIAVAWAIQAGIDKLCLQQQVWGRMQRSAFSGCARHSTLSDDANPGTCCCQAPPRSR